MAIAGKPDVVVIGAGIFGLSVAHACLGLGMRVELREQAVPGSGASGGPVGALAPHVPEAWSAKKAFQLAALTSAPTFWAAVAAESGIDPGYGRIGRLIPLKNAEERARAERRALAAEQRWADAGTWSVINQAPGIEEAAAPFGLIAETLSARIDPRKAIQALAAAVRSRGAAFRDGHADALPVPGARATVVAAGAASFPLLAPWLGAACGTGVKGQAARLGIRIGGPMIQAEGIYIVPHADGTTGVGSTSEDVWQDPAGTDDRLDRVLAQAAVICPALGGAPVLARWSGLRPKARGRDPMAGPVPGAAGLWAATGGFKTGFGLAHQIGRELALAIAGRGSVLPPGFSPDRHLG